MKFDLDVMLLFSANPATYNRSGKVIPQLKDRIGAVIHTHYPRERGVGVEIMEQEAGLDLGGRFPVVVPFFMKEIVEQISAAARESKFIDHASGVSSRFSISNYRTMIASARRRAAVLGEGPAVPRISDLGRLHASSLGKLELDMMSSHQMTERQVLDAVIAEAIRTVFEEYVEAHGLDEIGEIFAKGMKIEVGDMLPSSHYAERLERIPPVWEKAFEVNAATDAGVRASCVEFMLRASTPPTVFPAASDTVGLSTKRSPRSDPQPACNQHGARRTSDERSVDSSVAAHLLLSAGHDVIGVFMRHGERSEVACASSGDAAPGLSLPVLPSEPARRDGKQGCCSASDAADARRVADRFGLPFYALNLQEEFGRIIDYFVDEYAAGRTPNPCVVCNTWLKFGKLFDYADDVGAEFVATGHYARLERDGAGLPGAAARRRPR